MNDDPMRFGEASSSGLGVPALRLLNFDVEYREKTYRVVIHDNENVGEYWKANDFIQKYV